MHPLISISNWIKVGAIRATDIANRLFDPYEEFTRPTEQKYPESLEEKAGKFERDMVHFWDHGISQYNLPPNSGDQALWHGVYTAMCAIRYSIKGAPALADLRECVNGLERHQSRYTFELPRLIRGIRADGTIEDNASNDQATGHLLGIYFLWKYGDLDSRADAAFLAKGLADQLIVHAYRLVNRSGEPTPHGKLIDGVKTDPLNLTLMLAILRVAYAITHESVYLGHYDNLVELYAPLIPYANVRLLWWEKTHHAHRAAIHYSILCDLESDHGLHRRYLRGLLRTWKMERKSGNPWIYYLVRRQVLVDPADIVNAVKHLEEFTLEDKQYNVERINSTNVETFKWGKRLRARQPLPRWKVGSQDFFWQRHLYSADDWGGNKVGNVRHNGLDFLIAYYGLKSLRLI